MILDVVDVENIHDLETAKQVIKLQGAELARLTTKIAELTQRLAQAEGRNEPKQLAIELTSLQEQLAALQQRVFGDSSERRPSDKPPKDKKPKKGHGPRKQPNLRELDYLFELPEDGRKCSCCGESLEPIAGMTEDADFITVIPREYLLVHGSRQKYRCKNECTIVTAPGMPKARDGGTYSIDFAAQVASDKYCDHAPLERQVRTMKRLGLDIDSQTLWDQINGLAERLEPTYEAIRQYVLGADVVGVDETYWRLMSKKGPAKKSSKKWWAWGITTADACWYSINDSRSAKTAAEVLDGFEGTILVDGYKAYETVARQVGEALRVANCWAHVRRYFVEAEPNYPEPCQAAIDLIGELFEIERGLPKPSELEGDAKQQALEMRAKRRDEESRPIVEKLRAWALQQRGLPKGGLRKAVDYMLSLWPGLTTFLDDPNIEIHNNGTERALRGMVLGRKNHYGSRSVRGTQVAAIYYTLVESAKLCGIDPQAYIRTVAARTIEEPGSVLLPCNYSG